MTDKKLNKILLQKGQTNLVSEPFYVGEKRVALSAFANGTGLPPGARITFQEVLYVDGGNSQGTICVPGKINPSNEFDYKPFVSCGCEPALTERLSYMEIDRQGWYRAVYVGPSRASVLLTVNELYVNAGTGCCSKPCCPIEVDLVVEKSVSSETIVSGDAGAFTIVLTNKGPDASRGGSLVDVLPEGFSYGTPSAVFTGGAIGTQPALAQLAAGDWHYTQIPPGGVITITIPFTATAVGSSFPRTNEAAVYPGIDEVDTNWVNNTDNVYYVIVKPTVDAWVTKTILNKALKEGDSFAYTVTVGNNGPRPISGLQVKDIVPEALNVSNITVVYSGGAAGGTPTLSELASGYAIATMPSGGTAVFTITGIAPVAGYYNNVASVKTPNTVEDLDTSNDTASTELVVVRRTADLYLEKTVVDASIKENDTFTFVLTIGNNGPDYANNMQVKDVLPPGLVAGSVAAVYSGGAAGAVPTIAQLAAGFGIATMPPGGVAVLTISGQAPTAGYYPNTAFVKTPSTVDDVDQSNNSSNAAVSVAVRTVDLQVQKVADQATYQIGETVEYSIAFSNNGPDDANGAIIEDVIPSDLINVSVGITYVGGAAGPIPTAASLAAGFVVPTLPVGGGGVITVLGETTVAGILVNATSIKPPTGRNETDPSNNNDLVVVTVKPAAYKKCGGESPEDLTTDDIVFVAGSLQKCVNGQVVPLECGDIVKTQSAACVDCETDHWITELNGAGVCIVANAGSYNPFTGTAVGSFADFSSPWGQVNFVGDNPPSRLVFSYTNPHACPVLVEAELTGHTNIFAIAGYTDGTIGAAYQLSEDPNEQLNNSFSNFSGTPKPNQMRHSFKLRGPTGYGTGAVYHEETVSGANYFKVLQPGQSITLYTTAWIILFQSDPIASTVVSHLNQNMKIQITKNGVLL